MSTYIMVLGISDRFLRLYFISEIIGPKTREIFRHYVQIPKLPSE